ncbi:MAG: MraY family glycosyltransferase [Dissulfurimicrobium sp.]|nr:glycosyltransferase family 4 protein [Dissulfurimicrobium hydrothermale]UKL13209.1 glycosyltransferase family 4 protein [Dissulfurimicrobium hydrothermale]
MLAIDAPNARSLHKRPIPRTGGLGIIAGTVAGLAILDEGWIFPLLILSCAIAAVSFLDDVKDIHAGYRLSIHLVAAYVLVGVFLRLQTGIIVAAVLALAWMTNLFNFMDGSDGLAGGMAALGFGFYGLASLLAGDITFSLANLAISAAASAFLIYNFHPARIFMGDAGSTFLGFLSGAIGLIGWQKGLWSLWSPMLIFSPFIIDSTLTLLKRLTRREKIWRAHCEHYYQRLIKMGYGHKNTALIEYCFMISSGAAGCFLPNGAAKWAVILFVACSYLAFILIIDISWKKFITKKCPGQ